MFKSSPNWREIAAVQEAELATLRAALDLAREHLAGIELRMNERAALVSITRDGRKNNFTFVRRGEIFRITTVGTWDDDVAGWKRDLFE
jgi:hypothetical protein